VPLKYYAESDQAKSAVQTIRDQLAASTAAASAQISVGGLTASEIDFHNSIADSMWEIITFILGTSFLILLVLLRSLFLPIIGVTMNVLCVGAAYGVQVAIFQWGWLPFLGFQDFGFVNSVILPLLLAIVFGLSMDYQVFLLTRIKEQKETAISAAEAARRGTSVAAPTVTAAATIMVGVFVVFVIFGVPTIQAAGLGAAIAVSVSAMLVQLAFMPALAVLLGERIWWMPAWLDRVLPRITPENRATPEPATTATTADMMRRSI
jgi:RND superfamily putative drug exporter